MGTSFNPFSANNLNATYPYSTQYNNLIPKNVILKKSGGFLLIAEDFYSESLAGNDAWNRYDPFNPYNTTGNYYLYNPYYNSYRPYYKTTSQGGRMRYYYNDIFMAEIDTALHMKWNNSIHKRQFDLDNDNHLSYAQLNAGRAIHFLFVENNESRSMISDNLLTADGDLKKVPLIRNEEKNYEFMPKLGKQIGAGQIIIPYLYFNKVGFALVSW
jgi:hypothetical protein